MSRATTFGTTTTSNFELNAALLYIYNLQLQGQIFESTMQLHHAGNLSSTTTG
jgi:hypothetical protein